MGVWEWDGSRPLDLIFLGRITVDLNPAYSGQVQEDFKPLKQVRYFEKFVGGSPANMAVGVTRHGLGMDGYRFYTRAKTVTRHWYNEASSQKKLDSWEGTVERES